VESLILDQLEVLDLLHYGTCSHLAFACVSEYISQHYSPRKLLERFFSMQECYAIFREAQKCLRVLISGSQVTGLFIGCLEMFKDSDMDIYINLKKEPRLAVALMETGYHLHADLSKSREGSASDDNALLSAMAMNKMILHSKYFFNVIVSVKEYCNEEGKAIQVIALLGPPMDIILEFHSTCVMNVITSEFAYCLYPMATICK
ncbi:hypothetical protein EDD18DRAFT_1061482, partial [Armillaria luteobubalina]